MRLRCSGFDWDDGNRSKCQKHGVSISEIEYVFLHSPRVAPDPKHSAEEERLIAVGKTSSGRPLFVAFTIRTATGRRLISAQSPRVTCMHARLQPMKRAVYEKAACEK
jgi:uncharacterized DUF497 family protein